MRTLLLATLVSALPAALPAQGVVIAPHVLFMEHRTRSGELTLYNPGSDPVEIAISTMFGYPVTDSAGEFTLRTIAEPDPSLPSAAQWIQAYPRRLSLAPGERQTVRLLARPPAGLADGEYWARLVVEAKGGVLPVTQVDSASDIRVGLNLEVRTILPLLYRKGVVRTGVAVSDLRTQVVGDSLVVRVHLMRQGNAAFLGTVSGALVDSTGRVEASFSLPHAVYIDMDPRFTVPVASLRPGAHRLRLELTSAREDIPAEKVLAITPVRDSIEVRLP